MADVPDTTSLSQSPPSDADVKAEGQLRRVLGDVYTFVRSTEVNKTILGFTFDHYIDEAKRAIKEDRVLRTASDASTGLGTRPSKLTAITKLQQDFNNSLSTLQDRAKAKDSGNAS